MDWLRQNPFLVVWVTTCGLGLVAQLAWLHHLRGGVARESAIQARLEAETSGLALEMRGMPITAPADKADERVDRRLARWGIADLGSDDERHSSGSNRSLDIVLATARLAEALRLRAKEQGVGLRPDETFGFSAYAAAAPDDESRPQVRVQLQAVRYVLDQLLSARPDEFVGVSRERPVSAHAPNSHAQTAGDAGDYFSPDRRLGLRTPAGCAPVLLRVVFLARTDGLRRVLNALGGGTAPTMVRLVEVEPAVASPTRAIAETDRLIASPAASRFSLVVECVVPLSP